MTASIISCPIDNITKKKIDIICGLKKIHQYEFISSAINDRLNKENVDSILDSYEEELLRENGVIDIGLNNKEKIASSGFLGKLRSIDDI